jgi:predicted AlkP superfamily phosphohydrolase/phosphomutase
MVLTRGVRLLAAVFLALGLRAGAEAPAPPRKVVVVSFDGAGGLELSRRLAAGELSKDGFARAAREGESAPRLAVVTPSLTSVSHAALSTGVPPGSSGIVGNTFHPAGAPLKARQRGFTTEPDVETLWEAATRQGKRVASLGWPGVTGTSDRTRTPIWLGYNQGLAQGSVWQGPSPDRPLGDAAALPPGISSFSPAKSLVLDGVSFLFVDSTDDGKANYDAVVAPGPAGGAAARARPGEWLALAARRDDGAERDVLFGRWAKLRTLAPDLSSVSLYLGSAFRTYAAPEDFRRALDDKAGFWPGPPDPVLLHGDAPDLESYVEQLRRLSRFFTDAYAVTAARRDWDLILSYDPVVDAGNHEFLVTDPAQPFYSPRRATEAAAALAGVWRIADEAAARYLAGAGTADLFFLSDHGARPMRRAFHPAAVLHAACLLRTRTGAGGRPETAEDSPVEFVHAGGGTGFVVVNRTSLPGGVVPDGEADTVVRRAADALRAAKDPAGLPVFAVVATRTEASALGLDHPNAGDLVVIAAGGTQLKNGLSPGGDANPFSLPDTPGQHGFDPDPALDGIFLHVGPGVPPRRLEAVRATDVAALVADRLGIRPPGATK